MDAPSLPTRPTSSASTAIRDESSSSKASVQLRAIIRVHDDAFSKEDVLIDLDCFPTIEAGDLLAIIPCKNGASNGREGQDSTSNSNRGEGRTSRLDAVDLNPAYNDESCRTNDAGIGKRYLFIAKAMPKDVKLKRTAMELSVSKHISDAFGLKHRSNVMLSNV